MAAKQYIRKPDSPRIFEQLPWYLIHLRLKDTSCKLLCKHQTPV